LKTYDVQNLTIHSLFEISFSYKDKFFEKIKLPKVYLNHFIQILNLFDYQIDLKRLNNFDLFNPIFINKSAQIVPTGQTNRFILSNSNNNICDLEIKFLEEFYNYATIKIIDVANFKDNKIFNDIKQSNFNALYLKGKDIKEINNILELNNNLEKLF
jgi:ferrochelatase